MCVCTPSIPEWYCGQGDCIWPDERKPGHAAPVKKESEATEMSGETELKLSACPFCGVDDLRDVWADNGNSWVACNKCHASGPVRTFIRHAKIDWARRATTPGYELVPEGTRDAIKCVIERWGRYMGDVTTLSELGRAMDAMIDTTQKGAPDV